MDSFDFPTVDRFDRESVKRVQKRLLEMAKQAVEILDRNHIKYVISNGTLLGAVRHRGFIPWDVDFDMYLFDDEYNRAVEVLRKELSKDIVVHDRQNDPIYWPCWSKLRDRYSAGYSREYPDDVAFRYTGVNIDLYRLKKINRNAVDLELKREYIEYLVRKHDSGLLSDEIYNKALTDGTTEYVSLLQENSEAPDDAGDVYFTLFAKKIEIDDILPLRKYNFENTQFWGPNHCDPILHDLYGDYMKLPDYKDRLPQYDSVEFSDTESSVIDT